MCGRMGRVPIRFGRAHTGYRRALRSILTRTMWYGMNPRGLPCIYKAATVLSVVCLK